MSSRIDTNFGRRGFLKAVAAATGAAPFSLPVVVGVTGVAAVAESGAAPLAEIAPASTEEGELKIVSFDLLEEQAKKILPPGRFAFTGPSGDGWTYRENRRAFNDFQFRAHLPAAVSTSPLWCRG
jgi:hypothetical protein